MHRLILLICTLSVVGALGCASQPSQPQEPAAEEKAPTDEPGATPQTATPQTATPQASWVAERTADAQERLAKSEAGKLLLRSIQAHGGLERWYANGPLFFRFNYSPLGDKTKRDTYQTVDTWASRARQQLADNRSIEFGWDGEKAWVSPADADIAINPRFWALTPYYFVGMPFVLADPGVNLEETATAELHGKTHDVLRATFGEDVGDSPDDYYVIYLDAETGRVGGLRYVVSYPGFFPEGGHSPEKLMVYEGDQTIDGITFAKEFPTYKWNTETDERGEKVTEVTMTEAEFRPNTPDAYFDVPDGARVIEGY